MKFRHALLAEDHPLMRQAILRLLSEHFESVSAVDQGDLVLDAVLEREPEALVLDISMPGRNGLEVLKQLRGKFPSLAIVMLSSRDASVYGRAAAERGADGFVSKSEAAKELWPCLEAAIDRRASFSAEDERPRRRG